MTAWCLEAHDIILAKLAAGRTKDLVSAQEAVRAGLVNRQQLGLGVELMRSSHRERVRKRLEVVLARV